MIGVLGFSGTGGRQAISVFLTEKPGLRGESPGFGIRTASLSLSSLVTLGEFLILPEEGQCIH